MRYLIILIFLTGCTGLSPQTELYDGIDEPARLENVKLTVAKKGFFETGWICLERGGYPAVLHPLLIVSLGCATVRWENGRVVECDVVYSSDSVLEHELNHCRGYRD